MKILFCFLLLATTAAAQDPDTLTVNASNLAIEPYVDFRTLYDYSQLPDTVMVATGNANMTGTVFYQSTGTEMLCCFAKRTLVVRKGRLVEAEIFDTNSGCKTTYRYAANDEVKVSTECKGSYARNAPPYH